MTDVDESRPYQPHPAPALMCQVGCQDQLTIGSLCSGYGGLEEGLRAVVGGTVSWHAEIDPHPAKVLAVRYPGVPNLGDITTADWRAVEPVDWLTAGYPCQPFSHAGKRKGSADERHLWPFVAAAIGALRPRRVLLENVAGHVSLGLDAVLWDLASLGYDATWGVVRAADAGAPHGRARIFIVAHDSHRVGREHPDRRQPRGAVTRPGAVAAANATASGRGRAERIERGLGSAECLAAGVEWGAYAPAIARWERVTGRPAPRPTERGRAGERLSPRFVEWMQGLSDGWVTDILPRSPALKCLGNGVVPQQAALAVRTLLSLEREVAA